MLILKFWLHISDRSSSSASSARDSDPLKRWKLTDEDWRNRSKRPEYEKAVEDMLEKTSTKDAPWYLVEANSKRYARVKVLETVCSPDGARHDRERDGGLARARSRDVAI